MMLFTYKEKQKSLLFCLILFREFYNNWLEGGSLASRCSLRTPYLLLIYCFIFISFFFVFLFCFVFVLSSVLFPDSPASFLSLVILLLRWPFVLSKKSVFFRRSCWFVRIYSGICDGSWWRRLKVLQRRCVSTGHFPSLIKARVIKEVGV